MKIIDKFGVPLAAWWLVLGATQVFADINCENQVNEEIGAHMQCAATNADLGTTVSFRRIASWSGNAGMTLVEICSRDLNEIGGKVEQVDGVKYLSIPAQLDHSGFDYPPLGKSCVRRYCSQDIDSFSIFVETVPIPITPVFWLGGAIGFSNAHFAITCDSIEVHGG